MVETLICPSKVCPKNENGKCMKSVEEYDKCRSNFINSFREAASRFGFSTTDIVEMEENMRRDGYLKDKHFNKM